MMRKSNYNNQPRGCKFSTNTTKNMVPVVLEELVERGARAQRRFAMRELRKIEKKTGSKP